ncbi:MAG: hypothetical protein ACRD0P_34790, partial [Stackebrandtia sp.]
LEVLLDDADEVSALRGRLRIDAQAWAAQLLDGDPATAAATAARIVATLYVSDAPFAPPPRWWATPLGRAIASRVGHPVAAGVSYATAAAMLGITRQGVGDLVKRDKLTRHPDGGVTSDSVRDRLSIRTVHHSP